MELSENWTVPTIVGIVVGAIIGKNWSKIKDATGSIMDTVERAIPGGKKK